MLSDDYLNLKKLFSPEMLWEILPERLLGRVKSKLNDNMGFITPDLKIVYPNLVFMINRFKIIGGGGNAIFIFIPYPAIYYLTAHYKRVLYDVLWEYWQYNGLLILDEDTMGTQINLPIRHFGLP